MSYRKEIEVSFSGVVTARVISHDDRTVGLKFFTPFIATNKNVEKKCKKAHEWADERIALCERQEVTTKGSER